LVADTCARETDPETGRGEQHTGCGQGDDGHQIDDEQRHDSDEALFRFVRIGLDAQSQRLRVVSENLANAQSTGTSPGADPYRRKIPTFKSEMDKELGVPLVALGGVQREQGEFRIKHEPGHPNADENGNVKYPNVNALVEMTDMREAQRSYEANINVISASRRMIQRTIDILKS